MRASHRINHGLMSLGSRRSVCRPRQGPLRRAYLAVYRSDQNTHQGGIPEDPGGALIPGDPLPVATGVIERRLMGEKKLARSIIALLPRKLSVCQ
jgi:hypothetical protein